MGRQVDTGATEICVRRNRILLHALRRMSRNDDKMSQSDETRTLSPRDGPVLRTHAGKRCQHATSGDLALPLTSGMELHTANVSVSVLGHTTGMARLCYNCCCRIVTGSTVTKGRGRVSVRREARVLGWVTRSLLAAIGATVVATLPLGSSSAVAAGSHQVSASTLLSRACTVTAASWVFRMKVHTTSGGAQVSEDIYFDPWGGLITITEKGDQTFHLIQNFTSTYIEGNRAYWDARRPEIASIAANRWIDVTSNKKFAASVTNLFQKKGDIPCGSTGQAWYVGKGVFNGVKVIKVLDDNLDTIYIERGTTPYILRVSGSGIAGGPSSVLVFSDYGVLPDDAAPPGAIPISELLGNKVNTL